MKKFPKISIILVSLAAIFFAIQIFYQRITPRTLGQIAFPMKEKWNLCVGGEIQEISTDGNGLILIKTSKALSSYNQVGGNLLWTVSIKDQRDSFPPVIAGERVFISDKTQLLAFDLKTGQELWRSSLISTDTWVPAASIKYVLINSISDRIDIYEAKSGTKLWGIPVGRGYTQAYIDNDIVYIVDDGVKALDAANGDILWELDNGQATGLSTFRNGIIYYMKYPGDNTFNLIAYNAKSRKELWEINFPDNYPSRLDLYNNFLFMAENETLYQIDSKNGEIKWKKVLSAPSNLSFIGNNLYVLERFNRIIHTLRKSVNSHTLTG